MKPHDTRLQASASHTRRAGSNGDAAGAAGAGARGHDDQRTPDGADALRVLVVEDLPRVQQLLRELIHEPGRLEVAGLAETEQEAIAQFQALMPQAVVIDLNLKAGTGLGVIAGLRRVPTPVRPLLIVLTNHALPVLESACLKAGADYFLDKSRDFHKVRTLLEHAWSTQSKLPDAPKPALDGRLRTGNNPVH